MAMTNMKINRRDLLRKGLVGSALGVAGLGAPVLSALPARANGGVTGPESTQVREIYELQAAFHRAKTTQDLDLMMLLWARDATFTNRSTAPPTVYQGFEAIKAFWQGSGSFTHHRFSLVPSFKTTIEVHGDTAYLYFECHDVGNFTSGSFGDPGMKTIINDTFLAGTLRQVAGRWLFQNMTAGPSSPLSYSHYYFP